MKCHTQTASLDRWPSDIRHQIFQGHQDRLVRAVIIAEEPGVLSGMRRAKDSAAELPVGFASSLTDGDEVAAGQAIANLNGFPFNIVRAENILLGELSKTSGIATQARQACNVARGCFQVVCGAFKKMPDAIKGQIRQAVEHGGMEIRMAPQPFVYLDKNYVRILGGVTRAMEAVASLNRPVVIQLRGERGPIGDEAVSAARMGAAILMVDTGKIADLKAVSQALNLAGLRSEVRLAFAGNLRLQDLALLRAHDVDAVDIGYSIVDAPCLPMRFDVNNF